MDQAKYLRSNQRLFDEALNEFCTKSFDFASLNEIVKRSEFNKGSFYYRFADKMDLYQAIMDIVNSEHLVLYNQRLLDRIPDATLTDYAMEAIASMADLDQIDSRYSKLLERFAMESLAFQSTIVARGISFVHLRFEAELTLYQSTMDSNQLHQFRSLFHLFYFSHSLFQSKFTMLPRIRSSLLEFESNSTVSLANDTHNTNHITTNKTDSYATLHMPFALIVGPRQSGKSSIANTMAQEAAIHYNSVILVDGVKQQVLWVKATKSIRMSFKQIEGKAKRYLQSADTSSQEIQIATYLRLSVKDKLAETIVIRHRYVYLWLLSQRIDTLILDDPMTQLSQVEQTLIFNTILKFRSRGGTMVLTSNPHPMLWQQSSHIAFLSTRGLSSFAATSDLHAKYPADSVIVKYSENGTEHRQLWSELSWRKPEFTTWLASKTVLEIQSIPLDFASIFKMETREELE
jgi:AcrR family transcriptional regulator/energy-coupling factor transporter ATP-binding protein EcfA2